MGTMKEVAIHTGKGVTIYAMWNEELDEFSDHVSDYSLLGLRLSNTTRHSHHHNALNVRFLIIIPTAFNLYIICKLDNLSWL